MRLTSIEFSFDLCNIYRDCPRGVPRGGQNVQKCAKMATFGFYGLNYWEMVQDRWVNAARRLTSVEFSFEPCNIYCDCPRGVGYPADTRSVGDSHPSCCNLYCCGTVHFAVFFSDLVTFFVINLWSRAVEQFLSARSTRSWLVDWFDL